MNEIYGQPEPGPARRLLVLPWGSPDALLAPAEDPLRRLLFVDEAPINRFQQTRTLWLGALTAGLLLLGLGLGLGLILRRMGRGRG